MNQVLLLFSLVIACIGRPSWSQPLPEECLDSSSLPGRELLQTMTWRVAQQEQGFRADEELEGFEFEGGRAEVHEGVQIFIHDASEAALTGMGRWIIIVPSGCTTRDVEQMADHMPEGSRANFTGDPSAGGLCWFVMLGTKAMVIQELKLHTWPSKPIVETDIAWEPIPDNETDTDGAPSMAEVNSRDPHNWLRWGLDRIDGRDGRDRDYSPPAVSRDGEGVHVYVLDGGIRTPHEDFGGRAIPTLAALFDHNAEGYQFDWRRAKGRTGTPRTGPAGAADGDWYLYIEASYPRKPGDRAALTSKPLTVSSPTALKFKYHMYGKTTGSLEVVVGTQVLRHETGDKGDSWLDARIDLTAYLGSSLEITFIGTRGAGVFGDIAIDKLEFEEFEAASSNASGASDAFDGSI